MKPCEVYYSFVQHLPFATLRTNMTFFTRMNDEMQSQLFFPLESLHANWTAVRTIWVVTLLVSGQVIFPLQACSADVTKKSENRSCQMWRKQILLLAGGTQWIQLLRIMTETRMIKNLKLFFQPFLFKQLPYLHSDLWDFA